MWYCTASSFRFKICNELQKIKLVLLFLPYLNELVLRLGVYTWNSYLMVQFQRKCSALLATTKLEVFMILFLDTPWCILEQLRVTSDIWLVCSTTWPHLVYYGSKHIFIECLTNLSCHTMLRHWQSHNNVYYNSASDVNICKTWSKMLIYYLHLAISVHFLGSFVPQLFFIEETYI